MWEIELSDKYLRKQKQFSRRHPAVLEALRFNADRYHKALSAGVNPMQITGGVRPEKYHGLVAIDTRGAPRKTAVARLYLYPDTEAQVLHFITMGFKNTQPDDLKEAKRYVDEVRGGKSHG